MRTEEYPDEIKDIKYELFQARKQLAEAQAAAAVMREALEKCNRTFLTLEKLEGYKTPVPPNIVLQSVIATTKALSTTAGTAFLARMAEAEEKVEIVKRVFGLPDNICLEESLTAYRDDNANAVKCQRRLEWLHKCTGIRNDKDDEGYEWGVARVKFDEHGQLVSFLWTDSDSKDLDSEMEKDAFLKGEGV